LAFLTQNKAKLCKILIITLVFEKNANFCQRLTKIAENCDHCIDPWFEEFNVILVCARIHTFLSIFQFCHRKLWDGIQSIPASNLRSYEMICSTKITDLCYWKTSICPSLLFIFYYNNNYIILFLYYICPSLLFIFSYKYVPMFPGRLRKELLSLNNWSTLCKLRL
jgi:hypothetical protein